MRPYLTDFYHQNSWKIAKKGWPQLVDSWQLKTLLIDPQALDYRPRDEFGHSCLVRYERDGFTKHQKPRRCR